MSRSVQMDYEGLRERQAKVQEPGPQTGYATSYETLDSYQREDLT
jgi:hypothetical protein